LRIAHDQREDDGAAAPRRWPWVAAGSVVVVALLAGAGWWFFAGQPVAVKTANAAAPGPGGGAGALLQATGYVTARRQATVSTQITGTLTEVLIEQGDKVKAGQIIARLDDTALRAGLAAAQANLAAVEAQVAQAQAQLTQAESDTRRQNELVASGITTRQAAEQSRTALASAVAMLNARRREADAVRAQLTQAKVNFDFTLVRAPFTGVVIEKAAQVGEIVSPLSAGGGFTRTGVGTIVDMDSLEVDVDVNEAYIGQVSPNMPAEAVLDAYADWRIPAHVIAIVPAADRGKATVRVRVALEQKDARIVPNMGVRVSFLGRKVDAAAPALKGVLVPPQAIAQRDGKSVVFVVVDGKAAQRAVTPAAQDVGQMKLVPQGLAVGDRVVVSPPASLADGASVKIEAAPR
jgi:RND family efflux transporter MFP subunit